jgi:hypothetical protein
LKKSELKVLIKECLLEILSEDFIKKTINEHISDKIRVDVNIPGFGGKTVAATAINESTSPIKQQKKQAVSPELREKMRRAVLGEEDSTISQVAISPKIEEAINKFENPLLREMAKDSVVHEATTKTEQSGFSELEKKFVDLNKITAINEAVEERVSSNQ